MSETSEPPAPPAEPATPPLATLRRRRFSFVWLIPLMAAFIAMYLGYRTLVQQGPLLTLSFSTGDGLSTGQTQLKYKAVQLGTVESIDLSRDNSKVLVRVRMNDVGAKFLTSHARFWVVRPHFSPGDISGLDTLVSGAFIAVDPGTPGGTTKTSFTGLEEPPGIRSDEPGHTYVLKTETIGALSSGSPVYYRDVQVGEVLDYNLGNGFGPVTVSIFVRAPYDKLVEKNSHFWKSSGITAELRGGGFHIEVQSLQAIISGGVTFNVPEQAPGPMAPDKTVFPLYESQDEADAAGYQTQIPIATYFQSSVAGLATGAPVNVLGIQVGEVTGIKLILDPIGGATQARIDMTLQPERVFQAGTFTVPNVAPFTALQDMVNHGMRVELDSGSLVTGQKIISLTMVKGAGPVKVTQDGDTFILPSQPGGLDSIIASVSDISAKLDKIPFDQIGNNLNRLLLTANGTIGSQQVKQALASLSQTLKTANLTLHSVQQSYGNDSDFERNLGQLLGQADQTLRSVQLLSDYLNRHPQSLLFGRSDH